MTSGRRFDLEIFRHFFLADIISLKTMSRAVLRFGQPVVFRVQLCTVAIERTNAMGSRECPRAFDRIGGSDVLPDLMTALNVNQTGGSRRKPRA